MQIQVRTDSNIQGSQEMIAHVTGVVEGTLGRISDRITSVSVHLADENSDKKGGIIDIRCLMEADLDGHRPVAVTDHGATWEQSVAGAANKMLSALESILGRLAVQARARTDPPLEREAPQEGS